MGYKLIFAPDKQGKGPLILYDNTRIIVNVRSRSGSITEQGILKNCIPAKNYLIKSAPVLPVQSEYSAMYVDSAAGFGYKWRIEGHLLFHPDGLRPGSLGCVVYQNTNCMELYYFGLWYFSFKAAKPIPFEVHG